MTNSMSLGYFEGKIFKNFILFLTLFYGKFRIPIKTKSSIDTKSLSMRVEGLFSYFIICSREISIDTHKSIARALEF